MTATPIPRTIALTLYGDLELSTLKELPLGRKNITTWIVPPYKRKGAYDWIQTSVIEDKAQAFIICPLIEKSNQESMAQVKAATKEFESIKTLMPKVKIGLIHGKMSFKEKNAAIDFFAKAKTQVLVATPVVEVGIDIPDATIMVIEGAERFGLAQLHQLRGRVGRSDKKSYCLVFSQARGKTVSTRLRALTKSLSGFELAELDLKLRGPGEVFGLRQHGFPNLKIASWQDSELIKIAKDVATRISKNPEGYPLLSAGLKARGVAPN
jgi:ATP-dependent DNA helicase RecG